MSVRVFCLAIFASSLLLTVPAAAQTPDYVPKSAQIAGAMHASARVCQDYTDEQLRDLKRQHKDAAIAAGMSDASFEAAFQASYDETRAKLARATPAERERACEQLRMLAGMTRGSQ